MLMDKKLTKIAIRAFAMRENGNARRNNALQLVFLGEIHISRHLTEKNTIFKEFAVTFYQKEELMEAAFLSPFKMVD